MANLLENMTDDVKMSMLMDAVAGHIERPELIAELREWAMEVANGLPDESPHQKFCHDLIRELVETSLPDGAEHYYMYEYTLCCGVVRITEMHYCCEEDETNEVKMMINNEGKTSFKMWSHSRYKSEYFLDKVAEKLERDSTAAGHLYEIACARFQNFAVDRRTIRYCS